MYTSYVSMFCPHFFGPFSVYISLIICKAKGIYFFIAMITPQKHDILENSVIRTDRPNCKTEMEMLRFYEIWHMIILNAENNSMIQMLSIASQNTHDEFC